MIDLYYFSTLIFLKVFDKINLTSAYECKIEIEDTKFIKNNFHYTGSTQLFFTKCEPLKFHSIEIILRSEEKSLILQVNVYLLFMNMIEKKIFCTNLERNS